ncbi:SGNH/GDSL hydrolase family protein [Umezawaea beigongshangensis]|uniref:SGNH/GDSL hydrolase family protein n=1 Tax=Umezawaea beigongshangensis TaxID=2780383 RepID=UPI0018F2006A|nr:SGNH/GDSL hydrolase family protein [Umezawaea beigongshangensis]
MTNSSTSTALRFRVLGDSLAAGVGCARADETPGPRLAARLRASGREVDLSVLAVSGARSADLAAQVRTAVATGVDLALIVVGANDLIRFTAPEVGARLLRDAVARLRAAGAEVVVATAPDLSVASPVPPAYRTLVSQVSGFYARAQAEAVTGAGGVVAPVGRDLAARFAADPRLFSGDRFHPSAAGYALVVDALAPVLDAAAGRAAA